MKRDSIPVVVIISRIRKGAASYRGAAVKAGEIVFLWAETAGTLHSPVTVAPPVQPHASPCISMQTHARERSSTTERWDVGIYYINIGHKE